MYAGANSEDNHYLNKKWNKKLLTDEPLLRRPRSETVPDGLFTPWNETHIASTFATLGLQDSKRIHTSHSYSSLQLLRNTQQELFTPSVMDLRLSRPRAQSAVDRPNQQQNIWQPDIRNPLRPIQDNRRLRNSTSSADLVEMMSRQRKINSASSSPIYPDDLDPWVKEKKKKILFMIYC